MGTAFFTKIRTFTKKITKHNLSNDSDDNTELSK